MSSSEQFSWFEPPKKTKKSSSEATYLNAPDTAARPIEHVDMSAKHERNIDLHPTVLPAPLFEKLVGESNEDKKESSAGLHRFDVLPHVPIPVEQLAPEPARAEHPVYDPLQLERVSDEEDVAGEADPEFTDTEEEDEETGKKKQAAVARSTSAPLASPPVSVPGSGVEQVVERLDELAADAASGEVDDTPVGLSASEFMPLESEPENPMSALTNHAEREPDEDHSASAPPPPPTPPPTFQFAAAPTPEPSPSSVPDIYAEHPALAQEAPNTSHDYNRVPAPAYTQETQKKAVNEAEYYAEKRGLRRGLIAGFITGYAVKQYLANRKQHRFETAVERQIDQRDTQITTLENNQQRMNEQLSNQRQQLDSYAYGNQVPAVRYEQPVAPQPLQERPVQQQRFEQPMQSRFEQPIVGGSPAARIAEAVPAAALAARPEQPKSTEQQLTPELQEVVEQIQNAEPGQEIVLPQGYRLERRGVYATLFKDGRELRGVLNYGEAYQSEQRKEQTPTALTADDQQGGGPMGGGAYAGSVGAPAVHGVLGSGQLDSTHALPTGQPSPVDPNRRLSVRQNPIIATLGNPVLWLGVAVLVIAYFIAALL